jgi:hypothetical protein
MRHVPGGPADSKLIITIVTVFFLGLFRIVIRRGGGGSAADLLRAGNLKNLKELRKTCEKLRKTDENLEKLKKT